MSGKVSAAVLEEAMRSRSAERGLESTPAADLLLGVELGGPKEVNVPVKNIIPSPFQPRLKIDPDRIEKLAENIKEVGLNQPIVVREIGFEKYELIAGETRWRAYIFLEMDAIPAHVRILDDAAAAKATVADNPLHDGLSDFEQGRAMKILMDTKAETTIAGLARVFGKDRADVRRYLSFFELPHEAIDALKTNDEALGRSAAKDLADLAAAGHALHVTEAVKMLVSGKLSQKRAVSWVKNKIDPKAKYDPLPVTNNAGKRLGSLVHTDKTIQFTVAPGADIELCKRLFIEALATAELNEASGND